MEAGKLRHRVMAILATGPSMSQAVADRVRDMPRVAVSDAFRLAPDADALCASDQAWWDRNPDALKFRGRKFAMTPPHGVESPPGELSTDTNSALLALHVALRVFKASLVYLHGLDMSAANGAHFFGKHSGLKNTPPARFEDFKRQFAEYRLPRGARVVNATPGSALTCYEFA